MTQRTSSGIPGPPVPPLVPGHLGTPSEEVCRAALTVLGAAEIVGDEELVRVAERRVREAGLGVQALKEWGRRVREAVPGARATYPRGAARDASDVVPAAAPVGDSAHVADTATPEKGEAMTDSASSVSDEIVEKAWAVGVKDVTGSAQPNPYRGPWDKPALRAALEAVWPEPLLNDAELAAVIVALRFTDSGESHDDVMSAITKLEAEDNRRYDESDGHA